MLLIILLFLSLLALFLYYLFHRNLISSIPGPPLRDYFPGGLSYSYLSNPKTISRVLCQLSEIYGDIFQFRLGPTNVLATANPQDIIQIVSSKSFSRAAGFTEAFRMLAPKGLFVMPNDIHSKTRSAIRETFNYQMLEAYHYKMSDAVAEFCDEFTKRTEGLPHGAFSEPVDMAVEMAPTTLSAIMNIAFGFDSTRTERLQIADLIEEILDEMMKDFVGHPIRHQLQIFGTRSNFNLVCRKIDKICKAFVDKRLKEQKTCKISRTDDVLDALLKQFKDDLIAVISLVVEFTIGGSHTTNQTVAWCFYETLKHPHVMQKVEEELKLLFKDLPLSQRVSADPFKRVSYLKKVWKETLRIHPISVGSIKHVEENVTLRGSGVRLKRGNTVLAHTSRTLKKEQYWKDPEHFDPERWGCEGEKREGDRVPAGVYVPFSLGPRNCPGLFLAEYEGLLTMVELHRRFRFRLACDPSEVSTATVFVENPTAIWPDGQIRGLPIKACRRTSL